MKKRLLCTVIMLAMLITTFVSCTTEPKDPVSTNDTTNATQAQTDLHSPSGVETDVNGNPIEAGQKVDANGFLLDGLPDELDYNQEAINFLVWDRTEYEEYEAGEIDSTEFILASLRARNIAVEERLGVTLNFQRTPGGSDNVEAFTTKVKVDVESGDQFEYDCISAYSRTIAMCAYSGLTKDLTATDYLNFKMPWWPDTLLNQSLINNKLYFASGDISLSIFHNYNVMYFNKTIAEDVGITSESLYKMVQDGTWTLDKFIELSEGIYKDTDNDGVKSNGDTYGFIANNTQSQPLVWGCGMNTIDVQQNGTMVVSDSYTGSTMQDIVIKLFGFLHSNPNALFASSTSIGNTAFAEGRSLFFSNIASYTMSKFNVEGLSFGILPIPKYTTDQDYHTVMGNAFSLYAIPDSKVDANKISAVLECMGSEGYRQVSPIVFEVAMKTRYASDNDIAKMFDIIRKSILFDNGRIFSSVVDDIFTKTYNTKVKNNDTNWMSEMEKIRTTLDTKVKALNDTFANLGK